MALTVRRERLSSKSRVAQVHSQVPVKSSPPTQWNRPGQRLLQSNSIPMKPKCGSRIKSTATTERMVRAI